MKIQYKFMELVVNALSIVMMAQLGYDMRGQFHIWKEYKDTFFTELREEEKNND